MRISRHHFSCYVTCKWHNECLWRLDCCENIINNPVWLIIEWFDMHCLDYCCTAYFLLKKPSIIVGEKNYSEVMGFEREKERKRNEWASNAWMEGGKRQGWGLEKEGWMTWGPDGLNEGQIGWSSVEQGNIVHHAHCLAVKEEGQSLTRIYHLCLNAGKRLWR